MNADDTDILPLTTGELLSHNLFAYGLNDPINNIDESGYLSTRNKWIIGGITVAVVVVAVVVVATGGMASPLILAAKGGVSALKVKSLEVLTKTGYAGTKGMGNALTAPTNRNGLRTAMQKLGGKPFEGAQAHHGLPWKFKDWFAKRGLNVNGTKFGAWVKGGGNGGHQS